ncbi:hypothetical protein [Spirosoma endbachense]|uniref:Uncharacterized protein n=1 Tax=Spirosoma endbachense TaxID=2666025 RepID=A0A6P1W2J9_9BACT|nr:hypothetical protein [Spirosoma endbachense]QHV97906.1 hypothetical protein GJR95_24140 [Spirosoma endbachense]
MNLTSSCVLSANNLELQYMQIRQYLNESVRFLGLAAYQASMASSIENGMKIVASWLKVECLNN